MKKNYFKFLNNIFKKPKEISLNFYLIDALMQKYLFKP